MHRANLLSSDQTLINGRNITFRWRLSKPSQWLVGLVSLLLPLAAIRPAVGAERIYLSYGILERSIPISSLETFAKTGKVDDELAVYARRVKPTQLAHLRETLQRPISLDLVTVSQFLYTPIGERLLDRLGKVFKRMLVNLAFTASEPL